MRILLAVSGGIDSMYLAERAGDFFPGCSFAVAHCNFTLRGADHTLTEEEITRAMNKILKVAGEKYGAAIRG